MTTCINSYAGRFAESIQPTLVDQLVDSAIKAREIAYAPYSNYFVGAAVLMESGKIFAGHNVEIAALGSSICGERTAILKAITEGERKIVAVAFVLKDAQLICGPCGECRQMINEFKISPNTYVFMATPDGKVFKDWTINELLPDSFGPEHLL